MSALEKRFYTEEEYLALEESSEIKHEYFRGEIFAMAGGSQAHALIAHNVGVRLGMQVLERPCRIYGSDMRLLIEETRLQTFPDLSALCEEPRFTNASEHTLLNPSLIVEVLSMSTQRYDKTEKLRQYGMIPSLREYVLIAQYTVYVVRYSRSAGGEWKLSTYNSLEQSFTLESIGCTLNLKDIYLKVSF